MNELSDQKSDRYNIKEWKNGLITTKGWKLLVEWKYGTKYWIPMKDIKESNLVETSEYADTNNLL